MTTTGFSAEDKAYFAKTGLRLRHSQATIPRMGRRRKTVDQSTYSGRVAVRLRELREKAGKTVPEMAKSLKVPVPTYYGWENNRLEIPLDRFPEIAAILDVSVRRLLPNE